MNELSSFNNLLQARTGGEVAGEAPVLDLALLWEMALPTAQSETGESSEPLIETDDDDSEVTTGEPLAEMPWLGLPLVMEARAALRNGGGSGMGESALSTVTATTDSVDSTSLQSMTRWEDMVEAAMTDVAELPPVIGGTPTQAGLSSVALAHLDAGAAPSTLPTTPDLLNLHQKNWERTLGCQLSWMVSNGLQEAEIRVNPPDLGPLEVRVSLRHDQTSVTFFSHEAAVRDAIENALPQLREMLDSQGINLNQAQVSDQALSRQQAGAGEQSANGQHNGRWLLAASASEPVVDAVESQPRPRSRWGRVDDYA